MTDDSIFAAIGKCDPDEPLKPGDPRWCDFDALRGANLHVEVSRRLAGAETQQDYAHIALAGHRGCGKSTELQRVCAYARREGYLPLYAVVTNLTSETEFGFADLFLIMMRMVVDGFVAEKLPAPSGERIDEVLAWFATVTSVEADEVGYSVEAKAGAGVDTSTPWFKLVNLLFSLTGQLKAEGSRRKEVTETVEKYPDQLRANLNRLLDEARAQAAGRYPKGLLFVLDNIDRYSPLVVDSALLKHAELFKSIHAHLIFTVPISLLYNPPDETVEDRFDTTTLPMVPVFLRAQRTAEEATPQPDPTAVQRMVEAIHLRVPAALFADPALPAELARLSGGCPRDLMHMLKESLLKSSGPLLDDRAVRRGVNAVRNEFERKITRPQYAVLAETHRTGTIEPDETGRTLLFRRSALEYLDADADRWIGVHPLLWDTHEFGLALEAYARGQTDD